MGIIKYLLKRKQIKKDQLLFFIWPLLASAISFLLHAKFFISLFLFFVLPALFLSYRNKKKINKALLFSLSALVIVVLIDYICSITGIWLITNSILNYRLLGQVTIENIFWFPLWTIFIVMYYEYFYEYGDKDVLYRPRLKYLYAFFSSLLIIFFTAYIINKDLLLVKYFYLKLGIVLTLLPILLTLFKFPALFMKFIKTGIYFFYVSFIYELTALYLGQWIFPGKEIIGRVTIGKVFFPVKELFFWIMIGSLGILSYYEFFDDDCK